MGGGRGSLTYLAWDINVRDVLVLAQKRQMEQDRERRGIRGQDDQLRGTTIQGLGGLVRTLLQLAVMGRLLDQIQDVLSQSLVGDGPR